jgi:hypothetical protein
VNSDRTIPAALNELFEFPLVAALLGRRSRRFFLGAEIPDGIFAYRSRHEPVPLSELEKLLVVGACGGSTGWHHLHYRAQRYAPHLSNYSGAASGRTFPSTAGFHTTNLFFTDDEGIYLLDNRDAPAAADRAADGTLDLEDVVQALRSQVRKVQDGRLGVPPEEPFVEPHNTWVANRPGTLLVIPVGDLAQHALLLLCYLVQNGVALTDDINGRTIPDIERFEGLLDPESVLPITFVEQQVLAEVSAELATSCFAGALMLQAMGLGGWMYDGIDPFAVLGASGAEKAPGLGFRFDTDDRWPYPNPTGREGVMEAFCPPHYADMRAAVDAVVDRKFGPGGPFHSGTPGPWKDSRKVRSAARPHDEEFRECVALQAQYVFDTFGKFPGTLPSLFVHTYLQAHHLDLEFYDRFYEAGAYLRTHAEHMQRWHGGHRSGE